MFQLHYIAIHIEIAKEINEDSETAMLIKTKEEHFSKIKEEIKKLHSYETPAIIKIDTEAEKEYYAWVKKCC